MDKYSQHYTNRAIDRIIRKMSRTKLTARWHDGKLLTGWKDESRSTYGVKLNRLIHIKKRLSER